MRSRSSGPLDVWEISDAVEGAGAFPQIQTSIGGNWDIESPRSAYALVSWHRLPPRPPPFGELVLARRARLTDVLSAAQISGPGFLVNQRLRRLLTQLDLGEHGLYRARIRASQTHDYFWLQITNDVMRRIDFKRSKFGARGRRAAFRFGSVAALQHEQTASRKAGRLLSLEPKQIVLRGARGAYPDLFRFSFDIRVYASARLKTLFDHENVTGVEFRPAPIRFASADR